MATEEILTDDYVAGLLSQEASDCSIKYSAMGVDAFLSKDNKKPSNMPKPNTRFLRNIIKGTDSHNKALLAKEAAESKARLKKMERTEEMKRRKTNPTANDIRERHMGDIQAILGGKKRKRRDAEKDDDDKESKGDKRLEGRNKAGYNKSADGDTDAKHKMRSSRDRQSDRSRKHRNSQRSDSHRRRNSSSEDGHHSRRNKTSRDERSRSSATNDRLDSRRSRDSERRHGRRSPRRSRSPCPRTENIDDKSDILQEEVIGPAPPPVIRGRGAVGALSGIDRRFSASYDPKTDTQGVDDNA